MGALQPMHLIVILIVILIIFGPGKLTDLGGQLGRGVREFRQLSEGGDMPARATSYCTNCGSALSSDATFCTNCGRPAKAT